MSEPRPPLVAVILAAGAGTRIGAAESRVPKPLTNLLGTPLIARALTSARDAGITHAVVVVGHRGGLVEARAATAARSLGLDLTVVHNPRWMTGNGSSLLAADAHVADRCIVLMADHLTPASFIERLVREQTAVAGLLLVDPNPDAVHDLDEATKVRLEGDRIAAIGKRLRRFDAVDTGTFRFDRRVFEALRAEVAEGHGELSAAVQRLADARQMRAVASDGSFWCDVDTPEDLVVARRHLEREMQRQIVEASGRAAAAAGE